MSSNKRQIFFRCRIMKKDLVKKSNSLTEASYFLTVTEYRILHMAFSSLAGREVKPEFFRNMRFKIKAIDYMKLYGVERNAAYEALRDASERLFNRFFSYDELVNEDLLLYERIKSRWVTKIGYQEKQASISFFLSDDVLSMVGNLKEQFTYFNLIELSNLTSIYAIRIYEMLMQWRKRQAAPEISLEDLRLRLGISNDEYPRMHDFKKRVLDMALKQINENTSIIASYEQQKEGRKITGFCFKFEPKKQAVFPKAEIKQIKPDLFDGLTDLERSAVQSRIDAHIARLESKGETVGDFHRQNITKMAIKERWGVDELKAQQAKQQQVDERKEIEQRWKDTPNGTYFSHIKDGSLWFKEAGLLRNAENRVVPDGKIINIFQFLEEISEND